MPRPADPNAKDALVAAARREFAKKGLRGARIEDITTACGLSKGAFYLHFDSKEALFGELVEGFFAEVAKSGERREAEMARFAEPGPAFVEMMMAEDLRVLEMMWSYRDVVGVLIRGAQGTKFEGLIWAMTDGEIERIQDNFDRFQGAHACRTDVPSEIFASMIVGTYVLLGMRMSRMAEKPDLAAWARSLHTLIREGSDPEVQVRRVS